MPSRSLRVFEGNLLRDVDRLIELHDKLTATASGKKGLGHLTRSAFFLLCAAWEVYVEELLLETTHYFVTLLDSPFELPRETRKFLSSHVKNNKDESTPLKLAGDGWKQLLKDIVKTEISSLNTPKTINIDPLYSKCCGYKDISSEWTCGSQYIDDFVRVRGAIAHTGSNAQYIRIGNAKTAIATIKKTTVEMDNALATHINAITKKGLPWNRRTIP